MYLLELQPAGSSVHMHRSGASAGQTSPSSLLNWRICRSALQFHSGNIFGGSMRRLLAVCSLLLALIGAVALAQQQKKPSPDAYAATQIGGHYEGGAEPDYVDGKWIEISYGGPIKRGRDLWSSGASYGKMLYNGAPVWRAGADVSTYLMTQARLVINR